MVATTLIYLAGLAVFTAAGVALFALLDRAGRWLTPAAPAAGAALLVCLCHYLGFLLAGDVAGPLALLVALGLLALGVWRRPAPRNLRAALALSGGEALALGLGAAIGLLLLAPVLSIGFPTTIGATIADGWARSVLAEWLIDNPLIDSAQDVATARPVGRYSALPHELGAGFEYLVAMLSTLLGRRAYETALPVAALAGPLAVGGWAWLVEQLTTRAARAWQAAIVAVAALSPLLAAALAENYLTQAFSLALWPFAMAATYRFARAPGIASAALAAVALGAIVSVYPQLAPWIGVPALVLVLVVATRRLPALLMLGLALLVVAPLEVVRAVQAVVLFSDVINSNPALPLFQAEQDLELVLGGVSQFTLLRGAPTTWQLLPPVALMLGCVTVALVALWTLRPPARRPLIALVAAVAATTLGFYLKYKFGDDYGYGAFKALISGGALLAGLLVVTLATATTGLRAWAAAAAGVCLAVWVPTTAGILNTQRDGAQGFREADRALLAQLGRLPAADVVLLEGAAADPAGSDFRLRMTGGYFAGASEDRKVDGLGSTTSYVAPPGGDPKWRPQRPWRYVVATDAPSAFPAHRRTLWQQPPFRLQEAPPLDVTPYVPPGGRHNWVGAPPGSPPQDQIAGPVELVVANRGAQDTEAQLELGLRALQGKRPLTVSAPGGAPQRIRAGEREVRYPVRVPAGGTTVVTLDPGEPVLDGAGKPTPLVALTRVAVR